MKKLIAILACVALFASCSAKENSGDQSSEPNNTNRGYVDTYTSASASKTTLEGDDFNTAIDNLAAISSDLATKAETEADGYVAPESETYAQAMSVNPDGSVGVSTIHAWKVEKTETGAQVTVVMTEGQCIQNLYEVGDRGSIVVKTGEKGPYYIMHIKTADVKALEYSDEAYEAGEFNSAYSGAEAKATEYTVTFDITMLESTYAFVF